MLESGERLIENEIYFNSQVAQLVERVTVNHVVVGSIPTLGAEGCVAQLVEQEAFNFVVIGSNPVTPTMLLSSNG